MEMGSILNETMILPEMELERVWEIILDGTEQKL